MGSESKPRRVKVQGLLNASLRWSLHITFQCHNFIKAPRLDASVPRTWFQPWGTLTVLPAKPNGGKRLAYRVAMPYRDWGVTQLEGLFVTLSYIQLDKRSLAWVNIPETRLADMIGSLVKACVTECFNRDKQRIKDQQWNLYAVWVVGSLRTVARSHWGHLCQVHSLYFRKALCNK
jgi:hypothetical protein